MQNVDHSSAADARRVIYAGLGEIVMIAKLLGTILGEELHVVLAAEMQATCGAGFDACRLQPFADAVGTEGALVDSLGLGIEFGNVERAAGNAVTAADAVVLLKIDDAVRVLNDGAIGGARGEASRVGTVHALILAHEPHQGAVFSFVFIEANQVPVIPARVRHGLVAVVKNRGAEGQVVPFHAGDFAGLAADASGSVDELADLEFALRVLAGNGTSVG